MTRKSMRAEGFHSPYRKINPKRFEDLHIRHGSIKLLEENLGKTFSDINLSSVFLGLSYMARKIKAKPNKLDLIKLIIFYT